VLASVLATADQSALSRTGGPEGVAAGGRLAQDTALDLSRLGLFCTPRPGVTLRQLEDALDAVVADVIDKGFTAEDIERAKNRMDRRPCVRAATSPLARLWWRGADHRLTVEEVRGRPDRIRAVTVEAASEKRWLDPRRSVTG
jgi:zinc protease